MAPAQQALSPAHHHSGPRQPHTLPAWTGRQCHLAGVAGSAAGSALRHALVAHLHFFQGWYVPHPHRIFSRQARHEEPAHGGQGTVRPSCQPGRQAQFACHRPLQQPASQHPREAYRERPVRKSKAPQNPSASFTPNRFWKNASWLRRQEGGTGKDSEAGGGGAGRRIPSSGVAIQR